MAVSAHSTPTPANPLASSGITLTPRGEAYCLRHGREVTERRIDRHLALVTALLALLDQADGDENLEPCLAGIDGSPGDDREGDDVLDTGEPSLGWTDMQARYGRYDAWEGTEAELDQADDEPWLGAPETGVPGTSPWSMNRTTEGSQTRWAKGRGDDVEAVNEDGPEGGFNGEDGPTWAEAVDQNALEVGLC